jgi:hypothetical protein
VSEAVKLIVDGYVRLRHREKIEELRDHRQILRQSIQANAGEGFDTGNLMRAIEGDLVEIEAGLARLQ